MDRNTFKFGGNSVMCVTSVNDISSSSRLGGKLRQFRRPPRILLDKFKTRRAVGQRRTKFRSVMRLLERFNLRILFGQAGKRPSDVIWFPSKFTSSTSCGKSSSHRTRI